MTLFSSILSYIISVGTSLNFAIMFGMEKTRIVRLPESQKFDAMFRHNTRR